MHKYVMTQYDKNGHCLDDSGRDHSRPPVFDAQHDNTKAVLGWVWVGQELVRGWLLNWKCWWGCWGTKRRIVCLVYFKVISLSKKDGNVIFCVSSFTFITLVFLTLCIIKASYRWYRFLQRGRRAKEVRCVLERNTEREREREREREKCFTRDRQIWINRDS